MSSQGGDECIDVAGRQRFRKQVLLPRQPARDGHALDLDDPVSRVASGAAPARAAVRAPDCRLRRPVIARYANDARSAATRGLTVDAAAQPKPERFRTGRRSPRRTACQLIQLTTNGASMLASVTPRSVRRCAKFAPSSLILCFPDPRVRRQHPIGDDERIPISRGCQSRVVRRLVITDWSTRFFSSAAQGNRRMR